MFENAWCPSSYAINSQVNYGAWFDYSYAKLGRYTMDGPPAYFFGRVNLVEQVSLVIDCQRWFAWGWSVPEYSYGIDGDPGDGWGITGASFYAFRHPGKRANVLYYDGHLEARQHFFTSGRRVWSWKYP
jgi:prepilin-type processing-associated H-X9-DG protein